jgi:CheY-like chemotaxis protein
MMEKTILLVDDEPDIREVLNLCLISAIRFLPPKMGRMP